MAPAGLGGRGLRPSFMEPATPVGLRAGANLPSREGGRAARLEFTPVETAAQAVWDAVHGKGLHHLVGKTARRMWFAARFLRGSMRKRARAGG